MLYENVLVFGRVLRLIDAMTLGAGAAGLWLGAVYFGIWPADLRDAVLMYAGSLTVSFVVLAGQMKAYHARRTEHIFGELVSLLRVACYATGLSCLLVEVLSDGLPGKVYVMTALAGTASLLVARLIVRLVLRLLRRRQRDYRIWLMVGRNARSAHIAREILANPHFGIRIAQVVDLPATAGRDQQGRIESFTRPPLAQLPQSAVASTQKIRELIPRHAVDEVVICLPVRSFYAETEQIIHLCGEAGISVKLMPQAFNCPDYKTEVSQLGAIPLVTHYSGPASPALLAVKRVLDISVAAAGLLLLMPVHMLIAAAIKLSSPGPVFFRQQRVGLHARRFMLIKYRTMVVDAPEQQERLGRPRDTDGPAFKIKAE